MALAEAETFAVCVALGMAGGFGWAGPVVGDPAAANDATAPLIPPGCVGTVLLLIGGATVAGWFVCGVPDNWPNNDPAMLLGFAAAFDGGFSFADEFGREFAWGVEGVPPLTLLPAALFELLPNIIRHIPPRPCGGSLGGGELASAGGFLTRGGPLVSPGTAV
jgi:hypothetical protein